MPDCIYKAMYDELLIKLNEDFKFISYKNNCTEFHLVFFLIFQYYRWINAKENLFTLTQFIDKINKFEKYINERNEKRVWTWHKVGCIGSEGEVSIEIYPASFSYWVQKGSLKSYLSRENIKPWKLIQ